MLSSALFRNKLDIKESAIVRESICVCHYKIKATKHFFLCDVFYPKSNHVVRAVQNKVLLGVSGNITGLVSENCVFQSGFHLGVEDNCKIANPQESDWFADLSAD